MTSRFVFRLDGSRDNDEFFARRRADTCVAYSGTSMSVGSGWIPDIVEVEETGESAIVVTLIELEANESVARASCRKYLPESSAEIARSLAAYLETTARQCQQTTDPRFDEIERLRRKLASGITMTVRTAGALRTSPDFVEIHSLIDQADKVSVSMTSVSATPASVDFIGTRSFSRVEADGLRRTVRVLHAVLVGRDHSGTILHRWYNIRRKPLDDEIAKHPERFPNLHHLLSTNSRSGMQVRCDELANELGDLWRMSGVHQPPVDVAAVVGAFLPKAIAFSKQGLHADGLRIRPISSFARWVGVTRLSRRRLLTG